MMVTMRSVVVMMLGGAWCGDDYDEQDVDDARRRMVTMQRMGIKTINRVTARNRSKDETE